MRKRGQIKLLTVTKLPETKTIGSANKGIAALIVFKFGIITPRTLPKAIPESRAFPIKKA